VPVALFLSLVLLAAESAPTPVPERPACTAANAGQFWPEQANKDHKLAAKLARCGELRICTRGLFHYRWESPTVRADQLSKGALPIPAECREAQPEDGSPSPSRAQ
jgi:hypothetical protein